MSLDNAAQTYKNTENIYAKGIETPHGRIKIVFDVIEKNLEKVSSVHPKKADKFLSWMDCEYSNYTVSDGFSDWQ